MTDDALLGQLRAYATQLDELPAGSRPPIATDLHARPPRRSRRVWIAVAAVIAVVLAIALPRALDRSDGTGPSVGTGGALTVTRAWTRALGAQADRAIDVPGGPTIVDVAPENTGDSTLVALDRASGRVLWRHRFPYRNGPWGLDGNVLVTGIDGRTAAVDVRTGKQLWLVDVNAVSGEQAPPILVHDHVAYLVGGDDGVMTALDVTTHRALWHQTLGGTALVTPVVMNDLGVAVSPLPLDGGTGSIDILDLRTGALHSHTLVPGKAFIGLTASPVDGVFAATSQRFGLSLSAQPAQFVVVSDTRTCSDSFGGIPSNPVGVEHEIVVSSSLGFVDAYRCAGSAPGAPLWRTTGVGANQAPALEIAGGSTLVVAGASLAALRPADGTTVWTAPARDAYFPAPAAGDVVVATSRTDGKLYVVDVRDGSIVKTAQDGTAQTAVTLQRDAMVTASDQGVVTGYRITRR
jgi:outer membrane protein assembly factor BamB